MNGVMVTTSNNYGSIQYMVSETSHSSYIERKRGYKIVENGIR